MKNILILSKSDLHSDPRILKQIEALSGDYRITACGYTKSKAAGVEHDLDLFERILYTSTFTKLKYIFLLIFGRYKYLYWNGNNYEVYLALKDTKFDAIIANELETLPIAKRLASEQRIKIYCDLHEYYFVNKGKWWYYKLSKNYKKWVASFFTSVSHFTTINPGVVTLYSNEFSIDCELLDNACEYFDFTPKETDHENIRLITHGASIRPRKLELMIDVAELLDDRYTLDMYMMPSDLKYIEELKDKAKKLPKGKVNIYPGIAFKDIQATINQYDIGLYIIFPSHLNNRLSLPNKLFEFIQGRVAIAIGPSESMITVIDEYDLGVVADTFEPKNLADKINDLTTEDIDRFKSNTNIAARERNSNKNIKKIQTIVNNLCNNG